MGRRLKTFTRPHQASSSRANAIRMTTFRLHCVYELVCWHSSLTLGDGLQQDEDWTEVEELQSLPDPGGRPSANESSQAVCNPKPEPQLLQSVAEVFDEPSLRHMSSAVDHTDDSLLVSYGPS